MRHKAVWQVDFGELEMSPCQIRHTKRWWGLDYTTKFQRSCVGELRNCLLFQDLDLMSLVEDGFWWVDFHPWFLMVELRKMKYHGDHLQCRRKSTQSHPCRMILDGDFSLVSLFWARNQMCLNWKSGKSCGHRFHASWLSKLWTLEVSETESSGTSSSQEVKFTINLAVRSSYALRPDPLPFRGIQNLHKLETSFFGAVFT